MAPFVPLNSGAQVQIIHQLDAKIVSNRLWFIYDTPPFGLTELQGLSDGVASWWTAEVLPHLSSSLITANVQAADWTADPPPNVAVTVVNTPGGDSRESSTANVALIVPFRWPIGVTLKKNKHYLPGVPEEEISLNTPSATIRDAIWNAYTDLVDATRLFTPVLTWRWVATSAVEAGSLRSEQAWYTVQGTRNDQAFIIGQRRRRLPQGYAP